MIIGISGLAGSGKDTVADIFLKRKGIVKIALADPIKRFVKELWDFSYSQLWGESSQRSVQDIRFSKEVNGNIEYLTPRKCLQHLGTEGARFLDEDVFVRYGIKQAKLLLSSCYLNNSPTAGVYVSDAFNPIKAVIISDVRFINEIKYIKQEGGIIIKVVRPNAGLKEGFATHQSESEQSSVSNLSFNEIIDNSGTIDDLTIKVEKIIDKLGL